METDKQKQPTKYHTPDRVFFVSATLRKTGLPGFGDIKDCYDRNLFPYLTLVSGGKHLDSLG